MDPGERTTSTRDEHYNLVSVLYHALHGAENCDIYALDAEAGGRLDLSDFFREAQAMQRQLADEAKELLGIGGAVSGAGEVPADGARIEREVPPATAPADVPPTTDIVSGVPPGEVPVTEDTPRSGGVTPEAEGLRPDTTSLEREVPPETEPIDFPPTTDVPSDRMAPPPDTAPPTDVVPPGTTPGDVPPQSTDVQREAQVRAGEVGAPDEGIHPTTAVPRTAGRGSASGRRRPRGTGRASDGRRSAAGGRCPHGGHPNRYPKGRRCAHDGRGSGEPQRAPATGRGATGAREAHRGWRILHEPHKGNR